MKLKKKITVAIPCFNCSDNIENIIKNITRNINPNLINISISDNCSNDNSYTLINNLKKRYSSFQFNIYRQKKNIGAGENFKFLLKKANTEFFFWVGSDDILLNFRYEILELFNCKNIIGVSFKSFFIHKKSKLNKVHDKGNGSIISNYKIIRWIQYLNKPGVNSKFYSIFKTEVLKKSFCYNYCGKFAWDIIVVFNTLKYGSIEYTNKVKLVRQFGISSDPIKLRKSLFNNKINIFFPNLYPFFLILKDLKFFEKFVLFPFLFKYYLRLLISPVHHFLKR